MKNTRTVSGKSLFFLSLFGIILPSLSFGPRASINQNTVSIPNTVAIGRSTSITPAARTTLTAALRFNLLYDSLDLGALDLSREAYMDAVQGFLNLQAAGELHNAQVLTIVDFSLPSTQKRLFVIDMQNGRLLFNTLVAHGRNSGKLMATRFSNHFNSRMSSLGFYLTGDAFIGSHGYSLRLDGMEHGWNDHAHSRAIIMHPADYVSEDHVRQWGFLGRSEGCPAIPEELDRAIIDQIKGGSCLFLYAPDNHYLQRSDLLS